MRRALKPAFLLCLLISMMSSAVVAQEDSSKATRENAEKSLSTKLSLARVTNLYNFQDGTNYEGLMWNAEFLWKLFPRYTLASEIQYQQDIKDAANDDWGDVPLTLTRRGIETSTNTTGSLGATVLLPASKASRILNNLQAGIRLSGTIYNKPGTLGGLILGASLSLGQNLHQYETSLAGDVLNQYVSNQVIFAEYSSGRLSLSTQFVHRNALSYQGSLSEAFDSTQEAKFGITPAVEVSVGHTNSGDIFKANGRDSNVSLINENSSMVFATLALTI